MLIDMQSMAVESEVAFLVRISEEIRRQLGGDASEVATLDFHTGAKPSAVFHDVHRKIAGETPGPQAAAHV